MSRAARFGALVALLILPAALYLIPVFAVLILPWV